jgi:hypothetical protein
LNAEIPVRQTAIVPVLSLRPGESPRLNGEDKAHIERLVDTSEALPPILVHRRTMTVIDGMHRFAAASLKGQQMIDVEFFDGTEADAFLRAVEANTTHGLPLSQADRRVAAARIVASHPHMSDRAIAVSTGLAARTVARIRHRSTEGLPQLNARVGRDGKLRPVSGIEGRRRAARLMTENPRASLREVARDAGVSPATARDVRLRLERGQEPVPARPNTASAGGLPQGPGRAAQRCKVPPDAAAVLEKLSRDPSLRHNEQGRRLLRLLQYNMAAQREWPELIAVMPPHCAGLVAQIAGQYAQMWQSFADDVDERTRVIAPADRRHANGQTLFDKERTWMMPHSISGQMPLSSR